MEYDSCIGKRTRAKTRLFSSRVSCSLSVEREVSKRARIRKREKSVVAVEEDINVVEKGRIIRPEQVFEVSRENGDETRDGEFSVFAENGEASRVKNEVERFSVQTSTRANIEHVVVETAEFVPSQEIKVGHNEVETGGGGPPPREVVVEHVAVEVGIIPPPKERTAEHVELETCVVPPRGVNVENVSAEMGEVAPPPPPPPPPQYYCSPTMVRPRRFPVRWSENEENAIRNGVQRFGLGNWMLILKTYQHTFHERRTSVDLKDKWRNLMIQENKKLA